MNESTRAGRPVCSDLHGDAFALEGETRADSKPHAVVPGPGRDRRHGVVGLEALHPREVGVAQQPYLARDGREDLAGGQLVGDQRRHPPQRCVLVGELRCEACASSASRSRARASSAPACARRASSLTTYAVTMAIASAAPSSAACDRKAVNRRNEEVLEGQKRGERDDARRPEAPTDRDRKDREQIPSAHPRRLHGPLQGGDYERQAAIASTPTPSPAGTRRPAERTGGPSRL